MISDFCDNINELDEHLADKLELYNEKYTNLLPVKKRIKRFAKYINLKIWVFIAIVAVTAAQNDLAINNSGSQLLSWRFQINNYVKNAPLHFLVFCCLSIIMPLIATWLCDRFSKEAEGSGIPELKTYLSGLRVSQYVSFKSYLVKSVGLILMDGSAFGIGKEGPFIQQAAMIANFVSFAPIFRKLRKTSFYRNQMQIVSVAAGVSATFGSAYGGILFAIECCSALFLITNLWKSFVCATIVKQVYTPFVDPAGYINTMLIIEPQPLSQIVLHGIFVGIISGWLGSLWIFLFSKLQYWKKQTKYAFVRNRYIYVPMVSLFIACNTYWLPSTTVGPKGILAQLYYLFRLGDNKNIWSEDSVFSNIFLTFVTRYINCLLFATCPIPNGIFQPSLIIGALFGRMYGQFLQQDSSTVDARYYAQMGSAAYAAAVTRTTSVVLIIAEMTEQSTGLIGILIAVAISYSTANVFTMGFFDTVLSIKQLPYQPVLFEPETYRNTAVNVCEIIDRKNFLVKNCTIYDQLQQINRYDYIKIDDYIPVVSSWVDKKLEGAVRVFDCLEYLSLIGKILVKEFSKKKKLAANLMVFSDKIKLDRIIEIDTHLDGSYKQFGKISSEFHKFINLIEKNQPDIQFNNNRNIGLGHQKTGVKNQLKQHEVNKNLKAVKKNIKSQSLITTTPPLGRSLIQPENTSNPFENKPSPYSENIIKQSNRLFNSVAVDTNQKADDGGQGRITGQSPNSLDNFNKKNYQEKTSINTTSQQVNQNVPPLQCDTSIYNEEVPKANSAMGVGSREELPSQYPGLKEALKLGGRNNKNYMQFFVEILSSQPMDWTTEKLKFNNFPALVENNTKLVKVHYMFQMLGVGVIFVVDQSSQLIGKITREQFLNLRYKTKHKEE